MGGEGEGVVGDGVKKIQNSILDPIEPVVIIIYQKTWFLIVESEPDKFIKLNQQKEKNRIWYCSVIGSFWLSILRMKSQSVTYPANRLQNGVGRKRKSATIRRFFLSPHSTREPVRRLNVTIQMKGTEHFVPVVLFIMLYEVVLTCESVDETLLCDHSNESY